MSPLLVLIVAVLATTYAGPIVRFAAAPALAIAFWRLALVLPVTGVLAAQEGTAGSVGAQHAAPLRRGTPMLMTLAGLLLALHFWSWIASLRYTAVASSVVLVSLKSVFAWAIAALWLREHPTRTEAWGIALAVIGASLIGVADARLSFGALGGDGLALLGAAAGAGYYVIGRRVRQTVGIWRYATGVYAVAAAALALVALAAAVPLVERGKQSHTGDRMSLRAQFVLELARGHHAQAAALAEPRCSPGSSPPFTSPRGRRPWWGECSCSSGLACRWAGGSERGARENERGTWSKRGTRKSERGMVTPASCGKRPSLSVPRSAFRLPRYEG